MFESNSQFRFWHLASSFKPASVIFVPERSRIVNFGMAAKCGNAGVGNLRVLQMQRLQLAEIAEVGESVIGDGRSAEQQRGKLPQIAEAFQLLVGDVGIRQVDGPDAI